MPPSFAPAFAPALPLPLPSSFTVNTLSCRRPPTPVPRRPPHRRLLPLANHPPPPPPNPHPDLSPPPQEPASSVDLLPLPVAAQSSPPNPPPPPPEAPISPYDNPSLTITAAASLASFALGTLVGYLASAPTFPPALDLASAQASILAAVNDFVAGPHFAVSVGMGLSAFIQSLTGFGFAIVSVGALTQVPWIAHSSVFNVLQPVAATLGALTGWTLILPEIRKVDWKTISVLLIASTITTPIGAVMLDYFDTGLVIRALGALISGYVLYSVLGVQVPKKLGGTTGAWGMGFLAGALGGALDITGPPLVVHGEAAGWDTKNGDFRRNVLAVVTINSSLVVLWDLFAGRLNDFYYFDFVRCAAPTTVVGIVAGKILGDRLDPAAFKKIVLGTCMIMGVKLLFS